FRWLVDTAGIDMAEALRTYNCGIGMVLVMAADAAEAEVEALTAMGERIRVLGRIETSEGPAAVRYTGSLA
ncbi:MAG: AIR synthase-related protein, partial [Pseudomonadota bacterium]